MKKRDLARICEDIYVGLCIALLTGGLYLAFFAGSIRSTDGSTDLIAQAIRFPAYAYGLVILSVQLNAMLSASRRGLAISILCAICVLSTLWSIDPDVTLRRSLLLIATTLFGFALYVRYDAERIFVLLGITFTALALTIFVSAALLPSIAIHQDQHYPAVRGFFAHKNATSRMMLIGYVAGLALISLKGHRRLGFVAAASSAAAVFATLSVTGLASLIAITSIFYSTRMLRLFGVNFLVAISMLLLATLIAASGLLYSTAIDALDYSGRDLTLTGRTTIWAVLTQTMFENNPWLGFGYEAFWSSPKGAPSVAWGMDGFIPPHAHNGLMHAWAGIGIAGVGGLLYLLLKYIAMNMSAIFRAPTPYSYAYLSFCALVVFSNTTEVSLLVYGNVTWCLFIYSYLDMSRKRANA